MASFWKELWRPLGSITLLRQSHIVAVGKNCVWVSSEHLQGWRLHNLLRQPWVPVLNCHQGEKMFSAVWRNFLYFSLWPLPLVLSLDTTEKSLFFFFFVPSRYSYSRCSLSLLFFWLNSHSFLSLFSYLRCSSPTSTSRSALLPFVDSSQSFHVSYWGAQHWTHHSRCGLTSTLSYLVKLELYVI